MDRRLGQGGLICTRFFYLSAHVLTKLYESIERSHVDWLERKPRGERSVGEYEVSCTVVEGQGVDYKYKNRAVQIEKDVQKMIDVVLKSGRYTLTELRNLYIVEFYTIYRLIEEDLKD